MPIPFYHRGSWNRQYPHAEHEVGAYQRGSTLSPRYIEEANDYGPAHLNIGGMAESRRRQHNLDRYYLEQISGRWGRSESGDPRIPPEQGMGSSGYGTKTYSGARYIPGSRYSSGYHRYQPHGPASYGPEAMSGIERSSQYRFGGQGTRSVSYQASGGITQAGERMEQGGSRSREELGRLYGMSGQKGSGMEPDRYERLYGMGSRRYSTGAGESGSSSYGTEVSRNSVADLSTSRPGGSGMGSNQYGTSNYGTTSYSMSTGRYGTAGYGSMGGRNSAARGYAQSGRYRGRGEIFFPSRFGHRCERYDIPWQESVARVWGFPAQAGDIGTQDYCYPGEGRTGPVWQGRRQRGMQRSHHGSTDLPSGGSGLQGSEFTPYGREMVRSGAVPLYERGRYSSGMRQIAEGRGPGRTQFQQPSGTRYQKPSLTGIDKYRQTAAPLHRESPRRLWEQHESLQGGYSRPYSPAQFVTSRFARQAQYGSLLGGDSRPYSPAQFVTSRFARRVQPPSGPITHSSSLSPGGKAQGSAPYQQMAAGFEIKAPGDLSQEFSDWGFTAAMGAMPLYLRDIWSSRMRQIETTGAQARRGSAEPSWDRNRQSYGIGTYGAGTYGTRDYETIGITGTRFGAGRYGEERTTSASSDVLRGAYADMSGPGTQRVGELGAQQIGGPIGGRYSGVTSTPGAIGQMFGPTEQILRTKVGETTCLTRAETGPYIPGSDYNKPRREGLISYRKDQCGL